MKLIKFLYLSLSSVAILSITGCGTIKSSINLNPIKNADAVPLKSAKISDADLKRWSHLDIIKDTIPGMSVDRAYKEILKKKKGIKIIVAVLDSGTDIEHEDLKGKIWTNTKEIPSNGIDDDNNGYIDDIHGWNFLGNIEHENLELVRIIKKGDDGSNLYKRAKEDYDRKMNEVMSNKQQVDFILNVDKTIKDHLEKDNYTLEDVMGITTKDVTLMQYKMMMTQVLGKTSKEDFDKEIADFKDYIYNQLNYNLNLEFDGRKILGDDPDDITATKKGNNIVWGPTKEQTKHGTHVAGIITQIRGNKLGGDGVADNVEIMAIRAVPDGDEYDKDIALGIRYAVDNGAKIINTSFGKYYSPHKNWVHDAIRYAAEKDVLIVNAAGNDSFDLNTTTIYPNDTDDNGAEIADNFLTVGALNYEFGTNLVADFSNYGSKDVDVFAPGVKIYATTPNNSYDFLQGTSMASPNVAGVAALIRSYYPSLSAAEVKHLIMNSGVHINRKVIISGDETDKRFFKEISKTGTIVNAYNALIMAKKLSKEKVSKK